MVYSIWYGVHKDPTKHDFWHLPYIGPWNQNVRSLCLCGVLGPYGNLEYGCKVIDAGVRVPFVSGSATFILSNVLASTAS